MKKSGTGLKIFTIAIFSLLILSFCGERNSNLFPKNASAREMYEIGMKLLKKKKYEKARVVFSSLIEKHPKDRYTPRAKIGIADSYFKKGDLASLTLAYNEYREFVTLYPYHPKAAYAQLMMGMCYYKQMRKPGRDQTPTLKAIEEFKKVIERYPDSEEAKIARQRLKECEERYATHLLGIANFYFKVKKWLGAYWRYQELMKKYPDFSRIDEVYYKFGVSSFMLGKTDEVKAFLSKVITDFPRSEWALKAREFLESNEKTKRRKK
ncbi:MAG: outer membrane protein assembly factor BamD [Candidatus Aminicenantes bacterium]|nr:outer membrane protein assembly factor BamD [Candidatus Aminicenantes bacterium]